MKVLILGGTGVISRSIVEQLLARGDEVTLYNRGNSTLKFKGAVGQIIGDRSDRATFESAMKQQKFDVVIDMICFNAEDAASTVRAFGGHTGQIIVTSSVAAYKRPYRTVPTVESAEELWDDPDSFGYAYHKAEVERCLQKAIQADKLPITIIRPSLTYGPGAANLGVLRQNYGIIDRIKKGKPLVMFGDGTGSWTWTFAPDLAKAYVMAAGNAKTHGEVYHIASDEVHVWDDLYLEFGRIVGIEPKIVHIPSELLRQADPGLFSHLWYEKTYAGLFDISKFKAANPGYKMDVTLSEGIKGIAAWFEAEANKVDPAKDAMEDKLVAVYNGWSEQMKTLF
ncbi:MAG: NAD-dependent epimerase/dehydratase family protein [Negativicutes bacterium]|nr:NAD-dependent epimerase/dehydratase family protein [Negativicutes bacterium]